MCWGFNSGGGMIDSGGQRLPPPPHPRGPGTVQWARRAWVWRRVRQTAAGRLPPNMGGPMGGTASERVTVSPIGLVGGGQGTGQAEGRRRRRSSTEGEVGRMRVGGGRFTKVRADRPSEITDPLPLPPGEGERPGSGGG